MHVKVKGSGVQPNPIAYEEGKDDQEIQKVSAKQEIRE
jgi:hypothetical protein